MATRTRLICIDGKLIIDGVVMVPEPLTRDDRRAGAEDEEGGR